MSTTPANAASGVSRTTTITVNFDEAVMNVDTTSFAVAIGGNGVAGTLMQTAQTYVFTPSSMLMPNATVTVALSAAITDLAGNPLMQVSFSFGTGT